MMRSLLASTGASEDASCACGNSTGDGHDSEHHEDYSLNFLGDNYNSFLWLGFAAAAITFIFYVRERYLQRHCPWQVMYIAILEVTVYLLELFAHHEDAILIHLYNGNTVYWIRYAGWLLTCPVILIHLSQLSEENETHLTEQLLKMVTSNQVMIVFGITGAISSGASRPVCFIGGCIACGQLYVAAMEVYNRAYALYPAQALPYINLMRAIFFITWSLFPVFYILGPEGFDAISLETSVVLHVLNDMFAKNLWGFLAYYVRSNLLHDVAAKMGLSEAEYLRHRVYASSAVKDYMHEWEKQSLAGVSSELKLNLKIQTPRSRLESGTSDIETALQHYQVCTSQHTSLGSLLITLIVMTTIVSPSTPL
ncbi:hypothetical protein CYMTET_56505 [Cymbomonas tetramitiformis]|uniref:Uncharacterized protein n=1 Tax=Cymbomonas tetramitiformis TaxID=36881 RepID=A0AAE0BCA2_9CHLO|nr:hypothetical protein CYMTET_56505 [Cymbomonas tetramitiformis]